MNGDGLDDLIVGAFRDDPNGAFSPAPALSSSARLDGTAVELSDIEAGSGGFVINGVSADDHSGRSVSAAGDVNGDGLDDLIVGAYGSDDSQRAPVRRQLCRLRQDGRDGGGALGRRGRQSAAS